MKKIIILFSILILNSCSNEVRFNKKDWLINIDGFYVNRNNMLNDLLLKYDLNNLNEKEILDLLGKPEYYDDNVEGTIYYNIVTDYGWNIDPVYVKNLVIKFNSSNKVESFKIEETK
jgi:hypothetical protein